MGGAGAAKVARQRQKARESARTAHRAFTSYFPSVPTLTFTMPGIHMFTGLVGSGGSGGPTGAAAAAGAACSGCCRPSTAGARLGEARAAATTLERMLASSAASAGDAAVGTAAAGAVAAGAAAAAATAHNSSAEKAIDFIALLGWFEGVMVTAGRAPLRTTRQGGRRSRPRLRLRSTSSAPRRGQNGSQAISSRKRSTYAPPATGRT